MATYDYCHSKIKLMQTWDDSNTFIGGVSIALGSCLALFYGFSSMLSYRKFTWLFGFGVFIVILLLFVFGSMLVSFDTNNYQEATADGIYLTDKKASDDPLWQGLWGALGMVALTLVLHILGASDAIKGFDGIYTDASRLENVKRDAFFLIQDNIYDEMTDDKVKQWYEGENTNDKIVTEEEFNRSNLKNVYSNYDIYYSSMLDTMRKIAMRYQNWNSVAKFLNNTALNKAIEIAKKMEEVIDIDEIKNLYNQM